jgi:Abscisic acid G-protein coupled receptor/The Golgi pH Regulator (GPHR) Family N-terminal
MDVFLLATSFSASVSLPRFLFDGKIEQMTMAVSLGLSLSLFSLTIAEALPQSARILLSSEHWITALYFYLLWLLSIEIIVVLPGLCGATWAESLVKLFCGQYFYNTSAAARDDDKKHPPPYMRRMASWPWWLRFVGTTVRVVVQMIMLCFCRGFTLVSSRTRRNTVTGSTTRDSASTLVLTVHDQQREDIKTSVSSSSSTDSHMMDGPPSSPASKRNSVVSLTKSGTTATSQKPNTSTQYPARLRCWMAVGSICGVLSVIVVLGSIGPLIVQSPPSQEMNGAAGGLSLVVSWLCAVGLLLSSILNGFGSVSLPYSYLAGLFLKPVRPETISKLSSELQNLQEALLKKKALLREQTVEVTRSSMTIPSISNTQLRPSLPSSGAFAGIGSTTSNNSPSFHGSGSFSDLGDELKIRRQILQTEIEFLEDIIRETTMDIEELKYSQTVAVAARTGAGKLKSLVGVVFSVILLIRLCNAGWTIWRTTGFYASFHHHHHGSKKPADIVTTALLWLTGNKYVPAKRYALLSQMVSLTLAAVLSFSQVRTFLRTVTIVNRRLARFYCNFSCGNSTSNTGTAPNGLSLSTSSPTINTKTHIVSTHSQLIAGLLGCYSLACIVLIKMMLPAQFSVAFSKALGVDGIFVINSHVVNLVFFWSAMASSAVLGILLSIQRQNTFRHASDSTTKGYNDKEKGYTLPDV